MSAPRLPYPLRRRAAERARVEAFVAAIRETAPGAQPAMPTPREPVDEQPTVALPLELVRLLVPVR